MNRTRRAVVVLGVLGLTGIVLLGTANAVVLTRTDQWIVDDPDDLPHAQVAIVPGSLVLLANIVLLSFYTFSCHSLRHIVGGKLDCFSCAAFGGPRHGAWRGASFLNEHHMLFAWLSLFSVGLADLYIRLVASGSIHDLRLL